MPWCMESYQEDESGKHVPRIMQCGHSACHDCFARMLRPIVADENVSLDVKKLACPECRVVVEVWRSAWADFEGSYFPSKAFSSIWRIGSGRHGGIFLIKTLCIFEDRSV